jgi:putative DNA primase/helicase
MIVDKITSDEALSALLNVAIRGAQRLIKNGRFTEPEVVKEALSNYMTENSNTLSWIEDKDLDEDYFLDNATDYLYSEFTDWCKLSGIKTSNITGKKTFYKELAGKFGFEPKTRQRANGKRYFVSKI